MFFHKNQKNKNSSKQADQAFNNIESIGTFFLQSFKEVYLGIKKNNLSWPYCGLFVVIANITFLFCLDIMIFDYYGYSHIYLEYEALSWILYIILATFGFVSWGARESVAKNNMLKKLRTALIDAKLTTPSKRIPQFISDDPIDKYTRKLTLYNQGITKTQFEAAKDALGTKLKVYVDDVREKKEMGLTDIYYSHYPMPSEVRVEDFTKRKNHGFIVGRTRSKEVHGSFKDCPHLLIAGQTGGGKSNFLRQMITSLYVNNKKTHFTLIDLKEGLEFQIFKNLERVSVMEDFSSIVSQLGKLDKKLSERMALIKSQNCNDIDSYQKKMRSKGLKYNPLDRHFIIVDEAAELFLASDKNELENVQKARASLSRVARLGRACGMHLVIATQRPDVKAVDPQIKSNLTGVLCFLVPNLATSMTVLSNGRAMHLPSETPGRAIWKPGGTMTEVQTPLIPEEDINEALKPFRAEPVGPTNLKEPSKRNKNHVRRQNM
ncbi:MAG: hypothetical protein HRT44_11345 [Bdellovibrionales bacterium]|nr:hypothetical protein [Bdellovibrionales bacterium]NQZ19836.1 hypothetical protein [Bdellovibrionales bacterium]